MDGAEQANPPPGWYADPSGQLGWRWWAGDHWTEHVAPAAFPYPSVGGMSDQRAAAFLQGKQARLDGFIPVAVWIWAAVGIAGVLVNWANVDYYRALWHWWHAALHASSVGIPAPAQPMRPLSSSLFSLVSLGLLVIEVIFFIWQYRAATVARSLRYSALHSPGWGVGCWFVPVVNLWMPYQAIRDCLPSGHPIRRRVLYTWLLFLLTSLLLPATLVALVGAPSVGIVLAVASIGVYLAVGLNAYRVVMAIATDHRDGVVVLTSTTSSGGSNPPVVESGYVQALTTAYPQGSGSPYPQYPGYQERRALPATNGLAIASLVLSLLWFFGLASLVAIVFAVVALRRIKKSNESERGRGLAFAGLIVGICGLIGAVGFFLIVSNVSHISSEPQPPPQTLPTFGVPAPTSQPLTTLPVPANTQSTVNPLGVTLNVANPSGVGFSKVLVLDVAYPETIGYLSFAVASVGVCAGHGGSQSGPSSYSFVLGVSGGQKVHTSTDAIPSLGSGACTDAELEFEIPPGSTPRYVAYNHYRWLIPAH
jgi:Domain of unknown function (DUF4190)/Domain of unknown function (DUF4328)/Protein of unknown function (DUF2510)